MIKIINGLYETNPNVKGYLLAGSIYGPSYLSFELGIKLIEEDGYIYQIATPEKAVCDKLYTLTPIKNMNQLETVLFDDLRIDRDEFSKLNIHDLEEISNSYHSTNVELLYRYIKI